MDLAPPSHRGALIGLTVALSGLGLAAGPLIGGAISQAGGPALVFRWAALVAACNGIGILLYGRTWGREVTPMPFGQEGPGRA